MIQSALMLLAPGQEAPATPSAGPLRCRQMATRPALQAANLWQHRAVTGLAVLGNALGLLLFLAGLGLVLRLAEVLLS